jgi:hypothetical protein
VESAKSTFFQFRDFEEFIRMENSKIYEFPPEIKFQKYSV